VTGAASAEALVFREGEGAAWDALEVSPPDPGGDVAAGCPAGAGSLLELGLLPQPAENMQRLAIRGKANFFEFLGITRFLSCKRNFLGHIALRNVKWQSIVIGSASNSLLSVSIPPHFSPPQPQVAELEPVANTPVALPFVREEILPISRILRLSAVETSPGNLGSRASPQG
jgi:hypothetical protein